MDSGIRSDPDVARTLAGGAGFTFMGRTFMYGPAAPGKEGGNHSISVLKGLPAIPACLTSANTRS